MALPPSALSVAAERIKNKRDGVKEQLDLLKQADVQLESLECALSMELERSLCNVEKAFVALRENLNEKEKHCNMELQEAAEKRMKKMKDWRKERSEVCASAADVSKRVACGLHHITEYGTTVYKDLYGVPL